MTNGYRLWINTDRTMLVRVWADGICEVATRQAPWATWGPPMRLVEDAS